MEPNQPPQPPQPNQFSQPGSLFQLNMDASNTYALRGAASWAKVLAVVAIIFGILFFVFAGLIQNAYNQGLRLNSLFSSRDAEMAVTIYTVIFIVIGIIFLFSGIFALNFGNKIGRAFRTNDNDLLRSGFNALRNHLAFRTIIMIIFLLLTILVLVSALTQPDDSVRYRY